MRKTAFIFLLMSSLLFGGWERLLFFPRQCPISIIPTADSCYIMSVYDETFIGPQVRLAKLNSIGLPVWWTESYGDTGEAHYNQGLKTIATHDNSFLLSFYDFHLCVIDTGPDYDGKILSYILEFDFTGSLIDSLFFSDFQLTDIASTSDSGYIIAGNIWYSYSWPMEDCDILVMKVNSIWDTVWTWSYGGFGSQKVTRCIESKDSGFFLSCTTPDNMIIKLDALGDSLFMLPLPEHRIEEAIAVHDSGLALCGSMSSDSFNIAFTKITRTGILLWDRNYTFSLFRRVISMIETPSHGLVALGDMDTVPPSSLDTCRFIYLFQLDEEGDTLYTRLYGTSGFAAGIDISESPDGGFIILGFDGLGIFLKKFDTYDFSIIEENTFSKPKDLDVIIFPNPFNSSVRISIDAPVGAYCNTPLQIEIFDITGKRIFTESVGATPASPANKTDKACLVPTEFLWSPAPSVPSGIYLIKAKMGTIAFEKRVIYLK